MSRLLLLLILIGISRAASAQYVYTIKADSVKITNTCDTAELIIENHTQTVPGFLYNKGRGRTEFRRGMIAINDSMYIIGGDTLKISSPKANNGLSVTNNVIQLGQIPGQPGSPARLFGDREIPSSGYNLSLTGGGSLLINSATPNGAEKLQVTNGISVLDTVDASRFTINKSSNTATLKFNSVSSYSPTLTFIDNRGYVFGGNGQNTPLSVNSLISLYPKNLYDGYDPLINIQPYSADFMLRAIGAKNLSSGVSAGCGLHFQNDVNEIVQLYIAGSGASNLNGGPDAAVLWTRTAKGLRFSCYSSDPGAGIYFTTKGASDNQIQGLVNNAGNWIFSSGATVVDNGSKLQVTGNGTVSANMGIGGITAMSAKVHVAASDGSAGTAPVKLTAGAVLTTPENGAIEFDGADLYLTENGSRYKLTKTVGGQITTNFGGVALSAFTALTTTLTVTGAQPGDVVNVSANSGANPPSIIVTAFVTSANTVTLQAYNASNSAVTIASDAYKLRVIK
ncbi:hypothetical protein A4D02_32280 [Niastella koreensis]|uniref:Uncharacterized protein n=2 Tax=Niastella koreensis TaxID=354356 RepID=G8TBY7_NIAKG|nr:hypothetical protein [Niastella koreensis]AEV99280.1 hypothetical protein Niako_2949 [Niastella koreensis GR20-10]OQP46069.1 hypothetical protein A4D02_32280 [Niastella koreensis]